LWDLPVIFIIENNRYSMGTCQSRSSAGESLAQRAEGYGMDWAVVRGNYLLEVRAQTHAAIQRAHQTHKPMMLEFETYRYRGHSMSDPDQTYRTKEEIQAYRKAQDPISLYQTFLLNEKWIKPDQIEAIEEAAAAEAEEAAQFAVASPFPPEDEIRKDVYWEADHPEQKISQGTLFFN